MGLERKRRGQVSIKSLSFDLLILNPFVHGQLLRDNPLSKIAFSRLHIGEKRGKI